ncbi:hypothetical protein OSB04_010683 [Centaurea solstitialis]|uniref:Uncharacterized protein n=1 Tax=Centaurea solstitialis TaxID=347529 RepID=A0AA38WND9_9ASTR|nr:hypothetical protein OSB04_010683 [Centaurea solstitialis]
MLIASGCDCMSSRFNEQGGQRRVKWMIVAVDGGIDKGIEDLIVDLNDMEKLEDFVSKMEDLKSNLEVMESLLGVSKFDNVDVRNPKAIRKGCGTGKRLKSGKEIVLNNKHTQNNKSTFKVIQSEYQGYSEQQIYLLFRLSIYSGDEIGSLSIEVDYADGLKVWIFRVGDDLKPIVGQLFESLDKGIEISDGQTKPNRIEPMG